MRTKIGATRFVVPDARPDDRLSNHLHSAIAMVKVSTLPDNGTRRRIRRVSEVSVACLMIEQRRYLSP